MTEVSRIRTIKINGVNYTITTLGARQGIKRGTEILQMMAPILGAIMDDDTNATFADSTLFTEIAIHLATRIDSDKILEIVDELLSGLYRGSQSINYDEEFSARLEDLVQVIEFALRENFGGFFSNFFRAKGLEIPSLKELMERKDTSDLTLKEEFKEIQP